MGRTSETENAGPEGGDGERSWNTWDRSGGVIVIGMVDITVSALGCRL